MEMILFTCFLVYVDVFYCVRPLTHVNSCNLQSFPVFHVSVAALWAGPHLSTLAVAVATPPSSPSERRYAAESRYRTSGGSEPGWASAFCVISISKRVLTSDSRAPPSGLSFSGVFPGGTERRWGSAGCPAVFILTRLGQIFTEGGEGGGGVQDVPGMEVLLRGRRPVGDEDVVMVIGSERERQSGHPGRITDVREEIICKKRRSLTGPSVQRRDGSALEVIRVLTSTRNSL